MSKEKGHRFSLRTVIYNDKLLIIFSIILATIVWIATSMNVSPPIEKTITNVPIKVDLKNSLPEQFGLQIFNNTKQVISVKISGKKYAVRDISADDIEVTAITNSVTSAGKHTLELSVKPSSTKNDFEIVDFSPKSVELYFDTFKEFNTNIIPEVSGEVSIAEGFIQGDAVLSTDIVTVSGPTTEVNKVKKVVARASFADVLSETVTVKPELLALDELGNEVNNINLECDKSDITFTLPVLKKANLPIGVNFVNAPSGIDTASVSLTVSPSNLNIAASQSLLESTSKLIVGEIDFSQLKQGKNTFTFDLSKLTGFTILDTQYTVVDVTIDLSKYDTKSFNVSLENVQVANSPIGYTAKVNTSAMSNVKVMGSEASLDALQSSDITAVIDLTDTTARNSTGDYTVRFSVKNYADCWIVGSYKVSLTLTKEQ